MAKFYEKCFIFDRDDKTLNIFPDICPHLPIFTDNVPPIDTPTSPPRVNMDTIVDQRRVRTSDDTSIW